MSQTISCTQVHKNVEMYHNFTCYSWSTCLWLISITNMAILKCSAANGNLFTAHHIFLIQNDKHHVNFSLHFALCMKKPNQPSHLHICPTFQYSSHCHCFAHWHFHSLDRHLADTTCILALVLMHLQLWHVPLAVTTGILTPSPYIGSIKLHVHQSSSCMYLYFTFRTFMPS
jgi:hypothetical protein